MTAVRHFLQVKDFSREEYEYLFARAKWIKVGSPGTELEFAL